jgi:prepilin-type processing-associated H-X9-DG protein
MKLHFRKNRDRALARTDIVVIVAVLAVLAFIFLLPLLMHKAPPRRSPRSPQFDCVLNLKQVGLAFRIWEGDNNDKYPMSVSVTNGGAMELIADGNVAGCFQVMSNELSTPKILVCPADKGRVSAHTFRKDFDNSHISYFISPDASESYPRQIMSGDDNLALDDTPVNSGLVMIPYKDVSWTAGRHSPSGNILLADGSVAEVSSVGLKEAARLAVQGTPNATNRFVIP